MKMLTRWRNKVWKPLFALFLFLALGLNGWGQLIVSQYIETTTGSTPKGIELWNRSGSTIDFSVSNLIIKQGTNGAAPVTVTTISSGSLPANGVIVIGTNADVSGTGTGFKTFVEGNGATFYTYSFTFNGDDAIEVWLGTTIQDVFGTPGTDPGSGWAANGVQTYNQNISLKSGIVNADNNGWSDPSERFETTATDNSLTGFGIAPVIPTDNTPPTFTSTPSTSSVLSNSFNLTVNLDEIGTAYYVVAAQGTYTSLTPAEVKNHSVANVTYGTIACTTASTDFSAAVSGLTANTAYDIFVVAEDDETTPNIQASSTKISQTTAASLSTETDFTAFSLALQTGAATINTTNHTVTVEVPYGTNRNGLVATFTLSTGATAKVGTTSQTSGSTPNDFSSAVTYNITAQDGTTNQDWIVTVTLAEPSHDATITSTVYTVSGLTISGMPYQEKLDYFESKITPATNATFETYESNGTTVATDLKTGYLLKCTAQDGSTVNTYTISKDAEPAIDLFFSEYIEGSGNNKAIEIYNPTNSIIDLASYVVKVSNNGLGWGITTTGADTRYVLPLSGTIAPGETFVITNSLANTTILAVADVVLVYSSTVNGGDGNNVASFTGNDAIGLFKNGTLIDAIGQELVTTNFSVAGTAGAAAEHTIVRKPEVHYGNTYWLSSSGTNTTDSEWLVYAQNTATYLGTHVATDILAPTFAFVPANGLTQVSPSINLTITSDEDIYNIGGSSIANGDLAAKLSLYETATPANTVAFSATISGKKITVDPTANLKFNTQFTLSLLANRVQDLAGNQNALASTTFTTRTAYTDNTLSDLKVGTSTVQGFNATVLSYAVELPTGTTIVPTVSATQNDINANMVITQAANLTGTASERTATVVVTSEDGLSKTYSVVFTVTVPGSDATLSDLSLDGTTITGFSALTLTYNISFPANTTAIPVVTATTNDPAAGKVITQATNLTGTLAQRTATVVVTAQDGTTTKTYSVIFYVKSGDATLSALTYNGTSVPSFSASTLDYAVELPYGTSTVPTVAGTATFSGADIQVTQATNLDGTATERKATVLVTAEDNAFTKTYSVTFSVALNTDATVSSMNYTVNNSANTITDIPFGTTLEIFKLNIQAAENATFEVYEANGTTVATNLATGYKVIVTAQNPSFTKVYTITVNASNLVTNDLFFSEYIEGSSNNKAIEIYNGTGADVDLSVYSVKLGANGGNWGTPETLSGTLLNGDVFVIYNSGAGTGITSVGDIASTVTYFNGDDAIGLFKNDVLIDVFGTYQSDPGAAWDVAGVVGASLDHTIVRKNNVIEGNTDWAASAGTTADNSEWIVNAKDDFTYLGWHITKPLSTKTDILSFEVTGQQGTSIIDATNHTVDFDLPYGNDLSSITPTITVSEGATIDPTSGTAQNFSSSVTYTVTAEDGITEQEWIVTAHLVSPIVSYFEDDFEDGTLNKWNAVSVVGDQVWTIDATHGVDGSKCTKISGYSGGNLDNEDWLITPLIDLSAANNPTLSFYSACNYTGADLMVKYSTNYTGTGNPNDATWTNLTATLSAGTWTWTSSGDVDLSAITASTVSFAFVYTSNTTESKTWELDNVVIQGEGDDTFAPIASFNPANAAINVLADVHPTITFDENVFKAADGSAFTAGETVTTLVELFETTTPANTVAFTATITGKVITIIPSANLSNEVQYTVRLKANSVEDASGNENAVASSSFTIISSSAVVLSNVAITSVAPYYAGQSINLTWSSLNVTNVKIELFVPAKSGYITLVASTLSDGAESVTIPDTLGFSSGYKIRISNATDATINSETETFILRGIVKKLSQLYDLPADDTVKYVGTAVVTYVRNTSIYIQDSTAGMLIYGTGTFVTGFTRGDGITEVVGKVAVYKNLVELVPIENTGIKTTGYEIVPEVKTVSNIGRLDQSKIVKIEDFRFDGITTNDSLFKSGVNYKVAGYETSVFAFRTAFSESNYIGTTIPANPITVVAIVGQFNSTMQITSRDLNDFEIPASTDATLSNLTVDGETVDGFNSSVYTYNVELPYGTTTIPAVAAVTTDANATKVITQATALPGDATVVVTAEDGTTKLTYTVHFTVALSNIATLSDLKVSGTTVEGFSASTMVYTIILPAETTTVPTVAATATDANADVTITNAAAIPGITTVKVVAENGNDSLIYEVRFTLEGLSNDANLADLKVDGTTVEGFDADVLSYTIELPFGTTAIPEVSATPAEENADVEITQASDLPGVATVKVTAQDGVTSVIYEVEFTVAPSNVATLKNIMVDGDDLTDFASDKLVYVYVLPAGSTDPLTVTADATDENATVTITDATAIPGTTSIKVVAENGIDSLIYEIRFTLEGLSNDATLADLKVDGTTVDGFAADVYEYTISLPHGTTTVPEVSAAATSEAAAMVVNQATALPGDATVVVTAEDEATELIYTVHFVVEPNDDATLSVIKVNGTAVAGFDPAVLTYNIELQIGTTAIPVVAANATDANAVVVIAQAAALPGTATIDVTAEDGTTELSYTVNFTVKQAPKYTVTFAVKDQDGAAVEGASIAFDERTLTTDINGSAVFEQVSPAAHMPYTVTKTDYQTVEGNITVENANVTVDVVLEYIGVNENQQWVVNAYPNPVANKLTITLSKVEANGKVTISNIEGKVVKSFMLNELVNTVDVSELPQGIYLLNLQSDAGSSIRKMVKE